MKGRNIIPTLVIEEKFSLVSVLVFFLFFRFDLKILIQKLYGKNLLKKIPNVSWKFV